MSGAVAALFQDDVTPAAVNWANVSDTSSPVANANQTISGITSPITLQVDFTGSGTIAYSKNDGGYTGISSGGTLTVAHGDTLKFRVSASVTVSGTVTIKNNSDGGVTLDTFTYAITIASDATPDALDWSDISGSGGGTTNTQTISSIDVTITLQVNFTGSADLSYSKNGSAVGIANGGTFTVVNGDQVFFAATALFGTSGTVTIKNNSDGGVTLDTFNYTVT